MEQLLTEIGEERRALGQQRAKELIKNFLTKLEDLVGEEELETWCPKCGTRHLVRFKGLVL